MSDNEPQTRGMAKYAEAMAAVSDTDQNPETVDTRGVPSHIIGGTQRDDPPDDVLSNIETYKSIPQVYKGVNKFASAVVSPGWRVTADSSKTAEELEEWGEEAAIVGGETHQDVSGLVRQSVVFHQVTGNVVTEHVKPDKDSTDITGMRNIPVESLYPQTEPGKAVLIQPDDTDREDVETTARNEAAAYIQWHHKSALGRRGRLGGDRSEIPLSLNDITKTANSPGPSDIWGTSPLSTITDRVRALKQKLSDNEQAIAGKAYGVWTVGFGRDVIDPEGAPTEIVEYDQDDQDDFLDSLGSMDPGDIIGHDGSIELDRHSGETADILEYLLFDLDYIIAALNAPKFTVGHGEDVTQHVTEEQKAEYEEKKTEYRRMVERHFTPMFRKRAEQEGLDPSGVKFKLEPPDDESPITSLDSETIGDIHTYVQALKKSSPTGDPLDIVSEDSLRELVLMLPEDAAPEDDEGNGGLNESDPNVIEQFEQQMGELPAGDGEGDDEGDGDSDGDAEEPIPPNDG